MTPDAEEDIVDSSRSFLTRLSLEEAVAVLHRLQELMMRHIATVTDSANNLPPREALPSIPEIDPFKLSKRPLEEIAEELSKQLQELVDAYEASSAADRSLMGFRDRKPTEPFVGGSEINTTFGPLVDTQSGQKTHDATFGPMFNTKVIGTTDGGAEEEKRATGQEGQSSVFGEMYSTQYTYPNGTVISFPKSTFGEMVDTKSAASVCIPRVSISRDRKAIGTQTDPLDIPAADPASTTTTQSKTGAPMDRALLDRYLKALEGRLSQKEQLDALREAKRDLRKDAGAESLNHLAFQQKLN
ncbi:hypothetical protein AGDE_12664 [Angomonas deanei]|uniref:Uncharacterized protein n=1 Tax=Angomonas deanei TaxID=59799 RepID=A0A7G2C5H7_9TRYP|nr:hypothetical protein AGDE_12664 [Angomonas deanei]CAD2214996.1 hypothetical protein, conserved [Angomonas deanei]|eukprot:EPY23879.1 hypothetical protein AGDE_12664 [Angomonas deanei]